jgi:hypothetical protein
VARRTEDEVGRLARMAKAKVQPLIASLTAKQQNPQLMTSPASITLLGAITAVQNRNGKHIVVAGVIIHSLTLTLSLSIYQKAAF